MSLLLRGHLSLSLLAGLHTTARRTTRRKPAWPGGGRHSAARRPKAEPHLSRILGAAPAPRVPPEQGSHKKKEQEEQPWPGRSTTRRRGSGGGRRRGAGPRRAPRTAARVSSRVSRRGLCGTRGGWLVARPEESGMLNGCCIGAGGRGWGGLGWTRRSPGWQELQGDARLPRTPSPVSPGPRTDGRPLPNPPARTRQPPCAATGRW